jgi:hypothetical protein
MGSSDSKMADYDKEVFILNHLKTLPGDQILQKADEIKAILRIHPDKKRFTFGEKVEGKISI